MNHNRTLSLIVPLFDSGSYIDSLMQTLSSSQTLSLLTEVILVNDGSTDDTAARLNELAKSNNKFRGINLETNRGRFFCRFEGAKIAHGTHLLFVDARAGLPPCFGQALKTLFATHDSLMGVAKIDITKNVYNLYWQRTHETIFRRNYREAAEGFHVTSENYEDYVKGTTVFLCRRSDFLAACTKFEGRSLHSDDTFLMREIVKSTPIWVHDSLSIDWEPRQQFWPFLKRLWERGPQFAEYHVIHRQGFYFYLFIIWSLIVFATLTLIVIRPIAGLTVFAAELVLLIFSTAIFSRTPVEFLRMIPIHVGTVLAYGLGAIYGVAVNFNLFRKPPPTAAKRP